METAGCLRARHLSAKSLGSRANDFGGGTGGTMKLLGQLVVSLIILAVGTVVGVLVQQGRSERDARTRFLEEQVSRSNGLLNQARIPGRELAVSLDGKPIVNISGVSVALYNLSDVDFENVPVFIELKPTSGSPVEVVSAYAVGAADLPEGAVPILGLAPTRTTGAVRYGYTVKTVSVGKIRGLARRPCGRRRSFAAAAHGRDAVWASKGFRTWEAPPAGRPPRY